MLIEYSANNSGGSWWLKDEDWLALEKAGWKVGWADQENEYDRHGKRVLGTDGLPVFAVKKTPFIDRDRKADSRARWLGAIAMYAYKHFDTVKEALQEFERVTGANVMDEGCNCCGAPHSFSWDGGYCSGEQCGEYLYGETAKLTKRELLEGKGK